MKPWLLYWIKKNAGGGSGSGINWSEIGYEEEPAVIKKDFDYAKYILDTWDDSVTDMSNKFYNNKNLVYMPLVDTSNVTTMYKAFQGCSRLNTIPLLDVSNVKSMNSAFSGTILISVPLLNTAKAENFGYMFNQCTELVNVPQLDTNLVTFMYGMFTGCSNLSNDSLNNILAMCTSAISYTRTKTLKEIGLSQTQAETCMTLSNYQAFLDAGWTTGY